MYYIMQKLNNAALKNRCCFLALSMSIVALCSHTVMERYRYGIDNWNWYFGIGTGISEVVFRWNWNWYVQLVWN